MPTVSTNYIHVPWWGGNYSVQVDVGPNCNWQAYRYPDWLTFYCGGGGIGPVVTFGVVKSVAEIGLFIGSLLRYFKRDPGGRCRVFLSLRRHDPDQVQRVTAVQAAVSQPLPGPP